MTKEELENDMKPLPSNWCSRLVLVKEVIETEETTYLLCFRKGSTPKGCPRVIGEFNVECGFIHSHLETRFQNLGLGMKCYRTILHDIGELKTEYHKAAPRAQSIWKKLVKIYSHKTDFWSGTIAVAASGNFKGFPVETEVG